ncbi:uncharacterized protein LOC106153086 [Lingula anatina]|uniref:Uncharacterized protein LOC106153086 n=1 Tax=Lingula anatina TaxID=7574 RepID=A0A1S3H886_LINAN|nr:uncharacterized protein LOC106153086 [Lingula anatina]XP_013382329.1 uncharacterized protein LOC106153086 [Lingula anatina]XP_013382330.1 uncharacterized protein LOC106153086 [Lingula anatina]XP_013382331.1 uncharacterized protein LOC106153086 [Lingula anatina]XP_013382332.1 uncharacterized protein LOC106153086 [Lingula anatina]|eukprot:XP_013382328.1 uncharacterized protein LOC106153086 [Lingula anatina]
MASLKEGIIVTMLICVIITASTFIIMYDMDVTNITRLRKYISVPSVFNDREFTIGMKDTNKKYICIGIGCAVSTKGFNMSLVLSTLPVFTTLMPSFCETVSKGYSYHFYISYDYTDAFFKEQNSRDSFKAKFMDMVKKLCSSSIPIYLHFVRCPCKGAPAHAQNYAMIAAYNDSMDYLYRINDDTKMVTKSWTETFISELSKFNPPNVGVVGPNHQGGNTAIMTYDFVHRTHIDIFGFHYPAVFTGWFADDWITEVYKPNRSKKIANVKVIHTMAVGTRYNVRSDLATKVKGQVEHDKKTLNSWLKKNKL